jgi:hypothetical protein
MIIWGFGKVIKSIKGEVMEKDCQYCNTISMWRLSRNITWFTLYFIPIIPYRVTYCIECPRCGSYIEISKEKFVLIRDEIKERKKLGYNLSHEYGGGGNGEERVL